MPITTKIKNLYEAQTGLEALTSKVFPVKLPAKAAYAVGRLASAVDMECSRFNAERDKRFAEAGAKVVDGKWVAGDGPENAQKYAECMKYLDEMMDAQVEVSALPLDLEQFGSADVPARGFIGLEWAMKKDPE